MSGTFKHKYADHSEVAMRHEDGGFVSDVLIITANIPLIYGEPGFDEDKVNELINAAISYDADKSIQYQSIVFKGP